MKNSTRHKTKEAEYFLNEMKKFFEDDEIFAYNFSAFLSAARSITFHMQKQYCHIDGFCEWYCPNQTKMSNDDELKYLNTARCIDIHTEKVPTVATRQTSISTKVSITNNEMK